MKHLPDFKVCYSSELEFQRVVWTVDNIDWFIEMGYSKTLKWPEGLSSENAHEIDKEELEELISKEYRDNLDRYERSASELTDILRKTLNDLEVDMPFLSLYRLVLTRYRTGGSYHPPDTVVVNIEAGDTEVLSRVVIHEMIHLIIHSQIERYSIPHMQKEHLVDLIFEKIMPDIAVRQKLNADTNRVDSAFNTYYPDLDKLIESLSFENRS